MSTPVINAIENVNQTSLETIFAAVAADPTARDNLSLSNRNIDKVSTNRDLVLVLDSNEEAIRKILCRREGRDPANFPDLGSVASSVPLIRDLSVRESSTNIISFSDKANTAISADDRATREMMCHPAGLDATTFVDVSDVVSDDSAMSAIVADAEASRSMSSVELAMESVASSQTAMQNVTASQTAMDAVSASRRAMDQLAASQTARDAINASQLAFDTVSASNMAIGKFVVGTAGLTPSNFADMDAVAASQTAMEAVGLSNAAQDVVLNSNTATETLNAAAVSGSLLRETSRGNNRDATFGETNESYSVYFKSANYTGYAIDSCFDRYGLTEDGSFITESGGGVSQVFLEQAGVAWEANGECSSNAVDLSGEFEAVVF